MKKHKALRSDFPILKELVNNYPLIYVDNAATTQKPQYVLDAMMKFYITMNANIHRGTHSFAERATYEYENARKKVAMFIGALSEEIVFTGGCTSSINFVAATWGDSFINQGDEIVITELEHHANLLPWQRLVRKKGAVLKYIPVLPNGELDMSVLDTLITERTKLVSVVHVSNAIGTHNDVKNIIAHAKKVGAKTLIDAAQSIAHQKVDVRDLGCDFLVFSGHKVLGPTGVGVLFIDKSLHAQVEPYEVGGGMVDNVTLSEAIWSCPPHKFEAGTPPIAQVIGLGAAVDYMNRYIDFDELRVHEASLCSRLINGLSSIQQIRLLGDVENLKKNGHMVSFLVDGIHSHDVAAFLDLRGISVRAGHHCAQPFATKLGYGASVRVSFFAYNTLTEVDAIVAAIEQLVV